MKAKLFDGKENVIARDVEIVDTNPPPRVVVWRKRAFQLLTIFEDVAGKIANYHEITVFFVSENPLQVVVSELKQPDDIGRWVWYSDGHGEPEIGRIKAWDGRNVHVVYKCGGNWSRFTDYTAATTDPMNLTFADYNNPKDMGIITNLVKAERKLPQDGVSEPDAQLEKLLNQIVLCADGQMRVLVKIEPKFLTYQVHVGKSDKEQIFLLVSPTHRQLCEKDFLEGKLIPKTNYQTVTG